MKLAEKLKQAIDDGKFDDMFAEQERQEQILSARAAWFNRLGPAGRDRLTRLAVKKYSSDKYIDSEYAKGYEPRTPFFEFLFDYAGRYGKEMPMDCSIYFPHQYYLIDDKWLIREMNGQGTVYDVTEYDGSKYWQINEDTGLDIRFYTLHKKLEREIESFMSANGITDKEVHFSYVTGKSSTLATFRKHSDLGIAVPEKPVLYSMDKLC